MRNAQQSTNRARSMPHEIKEKFLKRTKKANTNTNTNTRHRHAPCISREKNT
jgi:hypothetical protein